MEHINFILFHQIVVKSFFKGCIYKDKINRKRVISNQALEAEKNKVNLRWLDPYKANGDAKTHLHMPG